MTFLECLKELEASCSGGEKSENVFPQRGKERLNRVFSPTIVGALLRNSVSGCPGLPTERNKERTGIVQSGRALSGETNTLGSKGGR